MTIQRQKPGPVAGSVDLDARKEFRSKYAVVISSIPKGGTHLMLQLFYYLKEYLPPKPGKYPNDSHRRHGWVEKDKDWFFTCALQALEPGKKICGHLLFPSKDKNFESRIKKLPFAKDFQNRHGVEFTFDSVENALSSRDDLRTAFIYRDPRDILISFVNMISRGVIDNKNHFVIHQVIIKNKSMREKLLASMEFIAGNEKILNMSYLLLYDGWMQSSKTLCIRYEDVVGSLGGESSDKQRLWIERILDWVGLGELDEMMIEQICDHMRTPTINGKGHFRKGTTGQWADIFDEREAELFKEMYPGLVERWGYSW